MNDEHNEIKVDEHELDDISIESYNGDTDSSQSPDDKIKKLREQIKTLSKEKQDYLDGWQRLKADFANYKKREEDEKSEFTKFAKEGIVVDLLPILESFQMAFANKEAWEKVDKNWRVGVEYIHHQFMSILGDNGLSIENPIGQQFNPTEQTSLGGIPTENKEQDHLVAEVVQVGYRLNGKIIKSPSVRVYEYTGDESK